MARWVNGGTPAQRAALKKAQLAAAIANRRRGKVSRGKRRKRYSSNPQKRGQGKAGLKKNAVPYARVNANSQTVGLNTGTIIPFTGKRVSFGGYLRLENTNRNKNIVNSTMSKTGRRLAPSGSRAGKVREYFNNNVTVTNPAVRAKVGGSEVRLGTSRRGGPTIILRRGRHKTPQIKSKAGIKKYNTRVTTIGKKKKTRRARRRR